MSTHSGLSAWQLTFLALGTVIGGSFFLGSAIAIRSAGPASLLAFIFGGLLVYIILSALSEMTVADPQPGSFRSYAKMAFGPFVGFLVGWVYWTGLILAMSSEAIAVSVMLRRWVPTIPLPSLAVIVVTGVTLVNLLGTRMLTTLETGLASIKLMVVVGFIIIAALLVFGLFPGKAPVGLGALTREPLLPGGIAGVAGSMLIVMFTYAGFEIIGLAAPEAQNPHRTVPRAIVSTILGLSGLYIIAISFLLPLIRTSSLGEEISPFVLALTIRDLTFAADVINVVLVTAILSTMLAAIFGLARMIRTLAAEGQAPKIIRDQGEIPFRGILFSGLSMLVGVSLGFVLPAQVYLFLVSAGGFALLSVYVVVLASHRRFRKAHGCPPSGHCQLKGFPFTSWLGLASLIIIIVSMPLIPGQGSGLLAGLSFVALYSGLYWVLKRSGSLSPESWNGLSPDTSFETSEELTCGRERPKQD